jgi:cysteine desulfurase
MAVKLPIYLDHNATTPTDPRVLEAMLPYFTEKFGNSASRNHKYGWDAEAAVDTAREQAASLIGANPKEIIWTSGSTESNNLAIKGAARMYAREGECKGHIITSSIEHKATLDPCKRLQMEGFDVTFLEPPADGVHTVEQVAQAIREDTVLVTIMWANNEIGTINPIAEIGKLCKSKGIVFHTDATQYVGKLPVDVNEAGVDLLSWSGHKIYGPKGVGALYVRRRKPRIRLEPIIDGGGHERGMRSGTLNVTGIVGFGKACELCQQEMAEEGARLAALRDRLEAQIFERLDGVQINGDKDKRLPHTSNISFAWVEGESLLMSMNEIAVSSGSACTSASLEPSYVLKNLGVGDELAHSSIRFGLGRHTTEEEIDYTIEKVIKGVEHLRKMSPLYDMHQEGIDLSQVEWAPSLGFEI